MREGDHELTLGPVGPLRHMGVVVARHSTQLLAPFSATTIPSICIDGSHEAGEERSGRDHRAWRQSRERAEARADGCTLLRSAEPIGVGAGAGGNRRQPRSVAGVGDRIAWRILVFGRRAWSGLFLLR